MKTTLFVLGVLILFSGCGHSSIPAVQSSEAPTGVTTMPATRVQHTEEEWREMLTPDQYAVLREKNTEQAFTGKYDHFFESGTYSCAACGAELFSSDTKFDSGCGWPAFYAAKAGDRVVLLQDFSLGMIRTEVLCANCGSHLGHVFADAPQTPTGNRFCINSVSLKFTPATSTQPAAKPSNSK